jgi:hypothetical protein
MLLRSLGKTQPDDEPLPLVAILDSNGIGIDDAAWCLLVVEGHDKEIRLFAVTCAREVQHLMKDPRSVEALDVAERYAHGNATKEELKQARDDAYAAVNAAYAAYVKAGAAATRAGRQGDSAAQATYAAAQAAAQATYAAAQAAAFAATDAANADLYAAYTAAAASRADARANPAEIFRRIFG